MHEDRQDEYSGQSIKPYTVLKTIKVIKFESLEKYFRNNVFPKFLITENSNLLEKWSSISLCIKPYDESMVGVFHPYFKKSVSALQTIFT